MVLRQRGGDKPQKTQEQIEEKLRKREENRKRVLEKRIAKAAKASFKIEKIKQRKQRKVDLELEMCPKE